MKVTTKIFTCKLCCFKTRKFSTLTNHYKYVHSSDPGFRIACEIDGCSRSYKSVKYLFRHIRSHHALFYNYHLNRVRGKFQFGDDSETSTSMQSEVGDDSPEMLTDEGNECASSHFYINWTNEIVTRLLALREEKLLPSVAIKDFNDHLQDLLALQHKETINKVISKLKEDGIDPKTLTDLKSSTSPAEASCHAVKSIRRFDAYVKCHFNFIQPQEFIIGEDQYGTPSPCQYVPILETLKDLLQYEDIFNEVVKGHKSQDTVLRNLCDGSVIANNQLF